MGLQDWLDKAAPATAQATALLKGGGSPRNDSGSLFEAGGPAISRFTGLPVVPTRLNLAMDFGVDLEVDRDDSSLAAPLAPIETTFAETTFTNTPIANAAATPTTASLPTSFFVDTDDLTDFNPLYPEPSVEFKASEPNGFQQNPYPQNTDPFGEASAQSLSHKTEDFYVAPSEAFTLTGNETPPETPLEGQREASQHLQFAWPNSDDDDDSFDSPAFSSSAFASSTFDLPTHALPTEQAATDLTDDGQPEATATTDDVFFDETFFEKPVAPVATDDDPFGLNTITQTPSQTFSSQSIADFGHDDFGLELTEPWDSLPLKTTPLKTTTATDLQTLDDADAYDPFTSDPLDAALFNESDEAFQPLADVFPLALDDLHPLYPSDDHGLLEPSLTIEPPDSPPIAWAEQQPWAATHHTDPLFDNPLDASPLHLLDTHDTDAFVSDWGLSLPDNLNLHAPPPEELSDPFSDDITPFTSSPNLEINSETNADSALNPTLDPAIAWENGAPFETMDWEGFETTSPDSFLDATRESTVDDTALNPIPTAVFEEAAAPWVEDEAWLNEAVAEDFLRLSTPTVPANDGLEALTSPLAPHVSSPLTTPLSTHASTPLPLAEAVTKNNRMRVTLLPDPQGTGVLLQASVSDSQISDSQISDSQTMGAAAPKPLPHLLKRFAKNPLTALSAFELPRLTLTEEARLKGKTLYRVELGQWRGIFSHSERNGIVFQDEWHTE